MANCASLDAEQGNYMASTLDGTSDMPNQPKSPNQESQARKTAGVWGYIFQIIFQVILVYDFIGVDFFCCMTLLF